MKIHRELAVERYGYFIQTWNHWTRSCGLGVEFTYSEYQGFVSRALELTFLWWEIRFEFYWFI
jgi:hypothetical protein